MQASEEFEGPLLKIGIVLQGEIARKFEAIKKKYGFQSNTDLFRLLVSEKFDEISTPILPSQRTLPR